MEQIIAHHLSSLTFGEARQYKNMAVLPLFAADHGGPEYLTLKEALAQGLLTVTEVSHGGSVPELMAVSRAAIPILLLDGEELSGAKQNRVLNTTILLREHSETVITVSCTEQGRWSYRSPEFVDSEVILAKNIRYKKARGVHANLRSSAEFRSNQGEVWDDIASMSREAGVHSPTGAMRDVYASREEILDGYLGAFPLVAGQKGILVFVNGKVSGLDVLSLQSAYAAVHQKLVKSYAMDAYLEVKTAAPGYTISADDALAFLHDAKRCKEGTYESIGHGLDYRYEGRTIVGSALVFRETVIHAAFFSASESERAGRMAGARQRRGHRL